MARRGVVNRGPQHYDIGSEEGVFEGGGDVEIGVGYSQLNNGNRMAAVPITDNPVKLSAGGGARKPAFQALPSFAQRQQEAVRETIRSLRASRFVTWTQEEMIQVLINEGIEVRATNTVQLESLMDLCDSFFENKKMPIKKSVPSGVILARTERGIRAFQKRVIRYLHQKRIQDLRRLEQQE